MPQHPSTPSPADTNAKAAELASAGRPPPALDAICAVLDRLFREISRADEQFLSPDPAQRRDAAVAALTAVPRMFESVSELQRVPSNERVYHCAYIFIMLAAALRRLPTADVQRLFKHKTRTNLEAELVAAAAELLVRRKWPIRRAAAFVGKLAGMKAEEVINLRDNVRFERRTRSPLDGIDVYDEVLKAGANDSEAEAIARVENLFANFGLDRTQRRCIR